MWLRILAVLLLAGLVAACDDSSDSGPEPERTPLSADRRACTDAGGQFVPIDSTRLACVFATRDAGQRCSSAQDCSGACLARSRTCAPLNPLYGCHQVLTANGALATDCRN